MNDCLFCKIVNGDIPSKKIYEDDLVIGILDINPDGEGHTLIIPKVHYTDYTELPDNLVLHIEKIKRLLADKLEDKLNKNAITFVVNYKDAQVIKHFHQHIIPGYKKEITKSIDEVYDLLTKE